jgi:hypothetical protein
MRQIFIEVVKNGPTSFILPIMYGEMTSVQSQFPSPLKEALASHLRKGMRVMRKLKEDKKSIFYQNWWNHGISKIGGIMGSNNTGTIERYMALVYDMMISIYYEEDHLPIFRGLMSASLQLSHLFHNVKDEETVNKLVPY